MAFKLALDASKVGMMTTANDGERRRMEGGGDMFDPFGRRVKKRKVTGLGMLL